MEHQLTEQEIFDQVITHMRKQGVKAARETGACMYRAPDGTKCAVGCLITDKEFDPDFEDSPVYILVNRPTFPERFAIHGSFLRLLQVAHDNLMPFRGSDIHDMSLWEIEMSKLATSRGLIYTPPSHGA